MIVRQFNEQGIKAFRGFLAAGRDNPQAPVPRGMLEDDALTKPIDAAVEIQQRQLVMRADAAKYLNDLLEPLPEHEVAVNAGLWTWLSLFFFDEICPRHHGRLDIKNNYTYVFEPRNPRHFYRHLLFIGWRVLRVSPTHNRLLLSSTVASLDQVTTEIMKRLYLTRIPCIFEVLDRLYWDERRGRVRPGIVTSRSVKPGDLVHRFPSRIRQLEKTYDLFSLNADQLIELLGSEFQHNGELVALR